MVQNTLAKYFINTRNLKTDFNSSNLVAKIASWQTEVNKVRMGTLLAGDMRLLSKQFEEIVGFVVFHVNIRIEVFDGDGFCKFQIDYIVGAVDDFKTIDEGICCWWSSRRWVCILLELYLCCLQRVMNSCRTGVVSVYSRCSPTTAILNIQSTVPLTSSSAIITSLRKAPQLLNNLSTSTSKLIISSLPNQTKNL